MAVAKCEDCGRRISDARRICPACERMASSDKKVSSAKRVRKSTKKEEDSSSNLMTIIWCVVAGCIFFFWFLPAMFGIFKMIGIGMLLTKIFGQ
ncbi:hypothetical protein [Polynucleobacter sp. UB-Piko-W3]|uniref:hypothetical protein n=1 Tax=Polynucleobacter sp. UB-Piko-W3 TaxID=1819735 RepID=UPI001C0B1D1C|nr:hypothetical protein [Polynucleobacter sp. UB-Piko-W3]MBU3554735.1 hypothetical protein [Polynucleobacter sp. UB-Piko-W3]